MNILENIVLSTKKRVEKEKNETPNFQIKSNPKIKKCSFQTALKERGMSFICEVKKASPSKGVIAEEFPYINIALEYQQAGANAISVLTEPDFFQGDITYLQEISQKVTIPVLRKDFIIDPYQIEQSYYMGANAILLIVAILTPIQLQQFIALAKQFHLDCLVEVHNKEELEIACTAGAKIIGVNNRNLKNFTVDFQNSIHLRKLVPENITFVAESGIKTPQEVELLYNNKVDAVLIGETLMRAQNKKEILQNLRGNIIK